MNKLKFWRLERGLSQYELQSASGIPRWAIQLLENDLKAPSQIEQDALSATLGISVDKIFPALSIEKVGANGLSN